MKFRMYFIGLVLGGVVLFGCGETKDVGAKMRDVVEEPKIATSKPIIKYKNFGNTYLKAPTPHDSVKIFVFNKFYHVKKQPYRFIKKKSHPGLYELRDPSQPIAYILFDSVGNIFKQENIKELNPFEKFNYPILREYPHLPKGENSIASDYTFFKIINLKESDKMLFTPNKLIPNYTKDIKPAYLQTIQWVNGEGRFYDIPKNILKTRKRYFRVYELQVLNEEFIPIKLIHQIELMSGKGELIRKFWFDDLGGLVEARISLDGREVIIHAGGDICCHGEGHLQMPHFRSYSIKTGKLIKKTTEYPYKEN